MNIDKIFYAFYNILPVSQHTQKSNIELIPLTKDSLNIYIKDLWEYSKNPDFYKFLEYLPFESLNRCKKYFSEKEKAIRNQMEMMWIIKLIDEEKAVGSFRLAYWDLPREITQIGYGISPNYGGKGLFSESLKIMTDYCFNTLGFYRLESWTRFDNLSSIKGLEKMGFTLEGHLRNYLLDHGGNRHDAVIYSLLNTD